MDTKRRNFLFVLLLAAIFCLPGFMITPGFASGAETAELPLVMKPNNIYVDGDELFIQEAHTISVYSLKTHKLKFKFGKRGEGPGEFKYPPRLVVLPQHIYAQDFDKIAYFSRTGKFLKEKRTGLEFSSLIPFHDKFILSDSDMSRAFEKNRVTTSIYICDSAFKKLKEIYRYEHIPHMFFPPGVNDNAVWEMIGHYTGFTCHRETKRIFVADSRKGFFITVFDETGTKLYTISKKVEKIKVGKAYKKNALGKLKENKRTWESLQNRKLTFPRYFPRIAGNLRIDGEKIYVPTHKKEGIDMEFVILDLKGNIQKQVFLPVLGAGAVFEIKYGKLYRLTENEKEGWELHISGI